jgi:hypothetical protein
MVFSEVNFEGVVVDKILLLPGTLAAVTDMAALVLVPTMCIQLVVSVEALTTEAALGMPFEAALIDRTGVIVAELLMLPKLRVCEKLVFVGEDFLVPRTEITST